MYSLQISFDDILEIWLKFALNLEGNVATSFLASNIKHLTFNSRLYCIFRANFKEQKTK